MELSIGECLTNSLFFSKLEKNSAVCEPGRVMLQYRSMPCALLNLWTVWSYCSFVSIWGFSGMLLVTFLRLFCARVAKAIIGIAPLIPESRVPLLSSRNNLSATWCVAASQWTMSILYSARRQRHFASLSVAFARLMTYFKAWWWVWTVNWVLFKYRLTSRIIQTTLRHSSWVVSKFRSRLLRIFDENPIGLSSSSSVFCSSTRNSRRSHVFVSNL